MSKRLKIGSVYEERRDIDNNSYDDCKIFEIVDREWINYGNGKHETIYTLSSYDGKEMLRMSKKEIKNSGLVHTFNVLNDCRTEFFYDTLNDVGTEYFVTFCMRCHNDFDNKVLNISIGHSVCNPADKFNSKFGEKMSKHRSKNNPIAKYTLGYSTYDRMNKKIAISIFDEVKKEYMRNMCIDKFI